MEKEYKNISSVEQLGIEPGQTGKADIPEDQEHRMVAREAVEVVTTKSNTPQEGNQTSESGSASQGTEDQSSTSGSSPGEKQEPAGDSAPGKKGR